MKRDCGPDSVQNLQIWREGMQIVKCAYSLSGAWPRRELHGLTAQLRRAAVSIPSDLAEGVGRGTPRESARFAQIALGSAYELDTLLQLSAELGLSTPDQISGLREHLSSVVKRISRFVAYQAKRTS
jgi:four helix bundle protein